MALNRSGLDITDTGAVRQVVQETQPAMIVNAAAYTAVDKAEDEPALAFRVNRDGAANLAQAAGEAGIPLIHLSTDYVFDGTSPRPYLETDPVAPIGVYGHSKWEGEEAVRKRLHHHLIIRVSWVFGVHGNNFVKTMLRLAAQRDELRVVSDQTGTPTWTRDLAGALWELMQEPQVGVFHFSDAGQASWYEFAAAIVEEARALGFPVQAQRVVPITTAEYPTPAQRPAYTVLSKAKIERLLAAPIPHWRDSLRAMLKELQQCPES